MREILFRGKRKDTGEWIEGITLQRHNDTDPQRDKCWFLTPDGYSFPIAIDTETVCQYTGLTDKDSRKIFEGDILEVCTFGFNPERFTTEVIYEKCAFRLKNGRNMFYFGQSDFTKMDDAKVIGNIFDNPELIT